MYILYKFTSDFLTKSTDQKLHSEYNMYLTLYTDSYYNCSLIILYFLMIFLFTLQHRHEVVISKKWLEILEI